MRTIDFMVPGGGMRSLAACLVSLFGLHEKGGKVNELPCHHNLERFLDDWLAVSGLAAEPTAPLFPTMRHGRLTGRHPMVQVDVYQMIRRRAAAAGIATKISCHSFRATGIII